MTPLEQLKRATAWLKTSKAQYAVAGGLAAAFYRHQPRSTKDVDLLLALETDRASEEEAVRLLTSLGLGVGLARSADLARAPRMSKKTTPVVMVIGRKRKAALESGIDILLPRMPWVREAIDRAQKNRIEYGFGKFPTLTAEDVVLSKAFALKDNPTRHRDIDDLMSIFQGAHPLEESYLAARLETYGLEIPEDAEAVAPATLRRVFRRVRRRRKR